MGEDMNIPLGTSIGAVFVPNEGRDFATLTDKADKALYKVKHHGKHGCAFFGEETLTDSTHKNTSRTQMILSERSREAGAYFTDFEKFKAIYQFTARLKENSSGSVQFLEITLDTDDDEAREEFLNMLIKILRRGDCVTRYGRNQFLALFNELSANDVKFIRQKISAMWRVKNLGGEIAFESWEL